MGRPVLLGNGSLTVGLNEHGLVHDFYYPYVGLDNLTTARSVPHKLGLWVDETFVWLDDTSWQVQVGMRDDALVSEVSFRHADLGLSVRCEDFVDSEFNVFCRRFHLVNETDRVRSVRLFTHQVFEISRAGRGDTALYVPDGPYVLDYKGRCSLLVYARTGDGVPFNEYSVGNCGIEGKEGTWRDAEDGVLSGNPVEHGGVDSVLGTALALSAREESVVEYWVVAADSQYAAERIHEKLLAQGLEARLDATCRWWQQWLETARAGVEPLPADRRQAVCKSLMIIKAHTDRRGGIIASCDSSIYNYGRDYYSYVWPRDGAYAMWPLIRLGYHEEPRRFFEFCRDIMHPDGYMMHKYQPDKAIGSTWHPLVHGKRAELAIQEDETAIIVYLLAEYLEETADNEFVSNLYNTMVQPMANFMADFRDEATGLPHASYDLWEEKFLTNTYTTALVHGALLHAAGLADTFAYPDDAVRWRTAADAIAAGCEVFWDPEREVLRKGYLLQEDGSLAFDNTLDVSSAYGAMMFAGKMMGAARIRQTFDYIAVHLQGSAPVGGCPRYEHDTYFRSDPAYMGNPWFVTTLWLSQYYTQIHRDTDADALVAWTLTHALPSGALSEQLNPSNGQPLSVLPLVWSHAELINSILDTVDAPVASDS